MTNDVKLSIVTPCYNSSKTIRNTLDSVEKQHYDNMEHIIIDGVSTDGTLDIVNEYKNSALFGIIAAIALALSIFLIYAGDLKNGILPENYGWIMNSGFYFTIPTVILIYQLATLESTSAIKLDNNKALNIIAKPFLTIAALSQYAFLLHVPVINLMHGILRRIGDVNIWVWSFASFVITVLFSIMVKRNVKRY